jgi:RNA polymerase sigma-70 factor (ECF subfamily)
MNADSKDLFEILIRENAAMLRVYLRSAVRDWTAAEDLFQETVLTAWQTLNRFDRTRPFGPWLRGIAAKNVLAYYRRRPNALQLCNEVMLEELDRKMTALHHQSGDTFDEKLVCLRKCLEELPEMLRIAIHQRYVLLLSRQEMAERLSVTDEAVKKRLQRARTQLLDCILGKLAETEGDR